MASPKARILLLGSREHNLVAYDGKNLASWDVTTGYPEVSFSALFGKLWYETIPAVTMLETTDMNPSSQNTAWYHFCLGLSKQLSTPCYLRHQLPFCSNLCKSIHTLTWKSRIKPTIEMMTISPVLFSDLLPVSFLLRLST